MKLEEFRIGGVFRSGHWLWRVTDIGTQGVTAKRVGVISFDESQPRTVPLDTARLEAMCDEVFKEATYGGEEEEQAFDEKDIEACSLYV